jgi:Uncharacterised nucleotidyltransferase
VQHSDEFERLIDALKVAVAALRERGIPFMLGGSMAAWARGGPEPKKDIDLMLKPADAQSALEALVQAGMRAERPPEDWLLKAYREDVLVDLIFGPSGIEMNDETLARAETIRVMALDTPVMAIEDMLVTMLCALDEHSLDYGPLVAIARSLREQVNWPDLRARTANSPYARAFFTLVEELGVVEPAPRRPSAGHIRVVN